jgi:hypothetical protein
MQVIKVYPDLVSFRLAGILTMYQFHTNLLNHEHIKAICLKGSSAWILTKPIITSFFRLSTFHFLLSCHIIWP